MKMSLARAQAGLLVLVIAVAFVGTYLTVARFLAEETRTQADELAALHLQNMQERVRSGIERYGTAIQTATQVPVLVHGVMQPETHLAALRDHIDHAKFQGSEVQVSVVGFDGAVLHRRTDDFAFEYQDVSTIQRLLAGEVPGVREVHQTEGMTLLRVGVPILRGGLAEGALIAEYPLLGIAELLEAHNRTGERIQLSFKDQIVYASDDDPEPPSWSAPLPGVALELRYAPDVSEFENRAEHVAALLAWIFLLGTLVALISGTALARIGITAPFGRLLDSIERTDGTADARVPTEQPFSEFRELALRFNSTLDGLTESRESLTELNQNLEILVEHRTEELARSNRELELFASVASHDLQEPIRKVASFCQLVEETQAEKLDDEGRTYLAFAVDGARRMQTLIQDLLQFSRVGAHDEALQPVDLNEVCDEAIDLLSESIRESSAEVTRTTLPETKARRSQMVQIFQNLIGNAVKYHGEDSPVIRITSFSEADAIRVTVQDNGIGIDTGSLEKVFGLFKRLQSRQDYPGTGIGLSVVQKIAEHHNGRAWAESTPGEGSSFHFTLENVRDEQLDA